MFISRKTAKQDKDLKHENAILRSALEVILSEIENARPESARIFALMALRGERHDEVTQDAREIRKTRLHVERTRGERNYLNAFAAQILVANS